MFGLKTSIPIKTKLERSLPRFPHFQQSEKEFENDQNVIIFRHKKLSPSKQYNEDT